MPLSFFAVVVSVDISCRHTSTFLRIKLFHFIAQTMIHGPGLFLRAVSGAGVFTKLDTVFFRVRLCHLQ